MDEVAKTKTCGKCKQEFPLNAEYFFRSKKNCGFKSICKKCSKNYIQKYRNEHKQEIKTSKKKWNSDHALELKFFRKKRYILNKEYANKFSKEYYHNNKNQFRIRYRKTRAIHYIKNRKSKLQYVKQYKIDHRQELNRKLRERKAKDIDFRMRCNLRSRIRIAVINQGTKKSKKSMELLGCSIPYLRQHLETKFLSRMTWNNYGKNGWEIDHIIPCVIFDLSKEQEQKICFHWTNLQPLWQKDNSAKNKIRKINLQ